MKMDPDLVSCMKSCKVQLEMMESTKKVNCFATLDQISYSPHSKLVENLDRLTHNYSDPKFGELADFTSSMAGVVRSRFG